MMVMTTKVDIKKILIALAGVAALILALILLFGGKSDAPANTAAISDNDARVKFLESFGWQVNASPTESSQVRIPEKQSEVYSRYNTLQKSQGYDLSKYAGKAVMRYVYKVTNFPGATEPVYATLLIYKNQVIGGDITDTSPKGVVQGFKMTEEQAAPAPSAPAETTAPTAA